MYKCNNCEEVFTDPYIKADSEYGFTDVCPYCSSEDITEVFICKICGERFCEDGFCEVCREKIQDDLRELKVKYPVMSDEEWLFDELLLELLEG